jgi:hypothetical protein
MEHNRLLQTFVETPTELAITHKLFSEEEREEIFDGVATAARR